MWFFFWRMLFVVFVFFFFQAEDGIRDADVTGVQTCALPIYGQSGRAGRGGSITPYLLPAYVTRRVRPDRIGHVTGIMSAGITVGLLGSRAEIGRASCRERG